MKRTFCIYSDESGVFDKIHNDKFVFGGIILNATEDEVSKAASLYKNIESTLRKKSEYDNINELKAVNLSFHDRRWVFSKLTPLYKFGTPFVTLLNEARENKVSSFIKFGLVV